MKILDPGHQYELTNLDGPGPLNILTFVKREGPDYPGNVGHHPGTNIQEVLRALIDRIQYLDHQLPCFENDIILSNLRFSLQFLEFRAARRHGRPMKMAAPEPAAGCAGRRGRPRAPFESIERIPVCPGCGHIGCDGKHKEHQ